MLHHPLLINNYQKENYNNKKLIERFYNLRKWEIKTIETDLSTGVKYTKELVYDSCKRLRHILINGKKLASYTYKSGGMLKSYTSWSIDGGGYTTEYVYNQSNQIVSEIVYEVGKDGIPIGKKYTLYTRDFEKSNENSKYEKHSHRVPKFIIGCYMVRIHIIRIKTYK